MLAFYQCLSESNDRMLMLISYRMCCLSLNFLWILLLPGKFKMTLDPCFFYISSHRFATLSLKNWLP